MPGARKYFTISIFGFALTALLFITSFLLLIIPSPSSAQEDNVDLICNGSEKRTTSVYAMFFKLGEMDTYPLTSMEYKIAIREKRIFMQPVWRNTGSESEWFEMCSVVWASEVVKFEDRCGMSYSLENPSRVYTLSRRDGSVDISGVNIEKYEGGHTAYSWSGHMQCVPDKGKLF